ncbi:hypothetical protein MUP77_24080 [Candidatus Bathyarchaeota archaeon]|nr:hypothetical protein [Candidatus Bathyarchaeota archaeon]
MDPEERELQVRLAELQADIQIYMTIAFGFFAGFLALILTYEQIFYSLTWDRNLERTVFSFAILAALAVCVLTFVYFGRRAEKARKQIRDLIVLPNAHSLRQKKKRT